MTNMTDMAGMLLNAATAASKPTTGTLVVSIVQSAVIGILVAPPLALFGTVVPKSVIVIQSALQFGYKELIQSIMGADLWSIDASWKFGHPRSPISKYGIRRVRRLSCLATCGC